MSTKLNHRFIKFMGLDDHDLVYPIIYGNYDMIGSQSTNFRSKVLQLTVDPDLYGEDFRRCYGSHTDFYFKDRSIIFTRVYAICYYCKCVLAFDDIVHYMRGTYIDFRLGDPRPKMWASGTWYTYDEFITKFVPNRVPNTPQQK